MSETTACSGCGRDAAKTAYCWGCGLAEEYCPCPAIKGTSANANAASRWIVKLAIHGECEVAVYANTRFEAIRAAEGAVRQVVEHDDGRGLQIDAGSAKERRWRPDESWALADGAPT